jgi:hypothetical protein
LQPLVNPNSAVVSDHPSVSCHLFSYIISIFTYISRHFHNNSILKHLRSIFFILPPLRYRDFRAFILSDMHMKMKVNHTSLCCGTTYLLSYNLIIYVVWSLISSSKDKIDMTRVLITVENNTMRIFLSM